MKINDHLIQSEQSVLGSVLCNNDCFDDMELKPSEFFHESHRIIYSGICEFLNAGNAVDLILLAEHLQKRGDLDRVGGLKYIGELVQNAVSTKTVKSHAKKISDGAKRRQLKTLVGELDAALDEHQDIENVLELADSGLSKLVEGDEEENFAHIGKAVAEAVDWEDAPHQGLMTGLRDLDQLTGGLGKSNMIIIAGRPSQGKSALSMQIAEHVSRNESVIVFSLEMSKREVATRFLRFHEDRVGKSQALSHLYGLKMFIDDKPAITLQHIRSQCRKIKRKQGLSLIVVDYLQLMQGNGDNRNQEIGAMSRGLKSIAKEFDIPVIVLSQLSRKVEERSDKRPLMSDLRDSGEIEQDADLILLIYRDETYNQNSDYKGLAEIICRKNRNGSIGDITTKFDGATTRFSDHNGERILRSVKKQERGFTI